MRRIFLSAPFVDRSRLVFLMTKSFWFGRIAHRAEKSSRKIQLIVGTGCNERSRQRHSSIIKRFPFHYSRYDERSLRCRGRVGRILGSRTRGDQSHLFRESESLKGLLSRNAQSSNYDWEQALRSQGPQRLMCNAPRYDYCGVTEMPFFGIAS